MTRAAIGLDVGGTKIAGAVVGANRETRCEEVVATPRGDVDHSADEILALIDRRAGVLGAAQLALEGRTGWAT